MRHSIWKLTALVGISGLGFMTLLHVQKGLVDAGPKAEAAADPPPATPDAARNPAPAAATPDPGYASAPPAMPACEGVPEPAAAGGSFASVPDDAGNPFAAQAEPAAGLDFRAEVPAEPGLLPEETAAKPVQTAALDPAADPFAEIDAAPAAGPVTQTNFNRRPGLPTGSGVSPAVSTSPAPAATSPAPTAPPAGNGDFGPDPFGDLMPAPTTPAEPAPAAASPNPMPEASPSRLLDADDPFATPPATVPAGPTDTAPPAGTPSSADDPFGAPAAVSPAAPPTERPSARSDDPFADMPAGPPTTSGPVPADPGFGDFGGDPGAFPAAPVQPAPTADDPFGTPAAEPMPAADPAPAAAPPAEHPRLLPSGSDELRGVGTVGPEDPQGPQRAELTIEKKAPAKATLGQPLVYEIVVKNVGDSPAHSVTVEDLVPRGTELQGSIPQAELNAKSLVWNLGTLAPGKASTIKVKVVPVEAGAIGSVATVNFVSEVAARTEVVAPHLTLKVTAPPTANLGEPVAITFEIANSGSGPAERVLLRELVPDGFRHPDGQDLEYEVGTLPPGKSESVTLTVAAIGAGRFTNRAILTAAGGQKAEATAAVEVVARRVSVTRQGPKRRYVGRSALYTNIVKNTSAEPVADAKVVEHVPAGLEFVNASHGGQFDADKRTVAWRTGPLGPGDVLTLQVQFNAVAEGTQDSTLTVEEVGGPAPAAAADDPFADAAGPAIVPASAELTSSTTVQPYPSLAPSLEGPNRPIAVGERAAFRVVVRNTGTADARDVRVQVGPLTSLRLADAKGATAARLPQGGFGFTFASPIPVGGEQAVDLIVEGRTAGRDRLHVEISAGHMDRPLVRDEELVVAPAVAAAR